MVTPGIATEDSLLDRRQNNYLASVYFTSPDLIGIAFLDISTGEFVISEGEQRDIDKLLQSFNPSEIIFSKAHKARFEKLFGETFYTFGLEEWVYTTDYTNEKILRHFEIATLKGFGIETSCHSPGCSRSYSSLSTRYQARWTEAYPYHQPDPIRALCLDGQVYYPQPGIASTSE